ncbi:TIGR00730 family Rossman fold protein [Paenibacillus physcomitrellae]|uniref:Cytokinin riboside 5'-monophosphate phosphoribohydrolase n=1 Tax=Paenibacillus physcomitrellae TaxID=1619311 RepID=A0ABQ1FLL8_9BACL|nr:TIGR00730 family Rossman fold protein [Paenibacillus physcomitrellae]GGA21401.1 LOG family protein YvdD [Paenibacillus physcomitrellae]
MQSVCVFAGSRPGTAPEYTDAAVSLGKALAEAGIKLVYGGSRNGLMGFTANEVLAGGGQVVGVMPTGLFKPEIVHRELTELIEVDGMHARKAKMGELADGFIALPGGVGTFEELFEVLCWSQIGIYNKPIGLLNVRGYYDPLISFVQHSVTEGFTGPATLDSIHVADDPIALLQAMNTQAAGLSGLTWEWKG